MATTAMRAGPARIRAEDIPFARRIVAFSFLLVFDFFYGWSWNTVDVLRPDIRAALDLTLNGAALMYTAQSAGALVGAVLIVPPPGRAGAWGAGLGASSGGRRVPPDEGSGQVSR